MPKSAIDKSVIFLLIIIAAMAAFGVTMASLLRVEPIQKAVDEDRPINIALILEHNGKPLSTQLLMYYPGNARGALLDIPAETGLILRSLNRFDRIDLLYKQADPGPYVSELAALCATNLDYYIVFTMQAYSDLVDMLDGLSIFMPNRVTGTLDERGFSLPAGSVLLDGGKMALYARYQEADRPESEAVARRQLLFQALLRRIGERSDYLFQKDVLAQLSKRVRTNLKPQSFERLLVEFARVDMDRAVIQRLTGTYRSVEGKQLLFPAWDGQLVKDIVKQTLNALLNAEATAVEDKVFTLEILNGTASRGLAQKTADIYESFGYEIVSIGNAASQDIAKTQILYRFNYEAAAAMVANVIRCENIASGDPELNSSAPADFVIILGRDFDGRYCVN
jgi:polyisoprenyl-teichoic acid--peptidoglycan teichoic acid transferase